MTSPKTSRNKSGKKRRSRSYRKPNAWQTSAAWRRIGSEAIRAFNARKHLLPKCGAHAKTTGEPCKNLALENGRCRVHGGRTPAGKQHGVRQFTPKPRSRQTNRDWPKVQAKLDRFAKQDKNRRVRLALMTPNEFADYFRRTHARHGIEFRKIVDTEMRRRGLTRSDIMPSKGAVLFDAKPAPVNPEVARLKEKINRLLALKAEIEAAQALADRIATLKTGTRPPGNTIPADPDQQADGDHPGADVDVDNLTGVFK